MLHTNWRDLPADARGMVLALGNFDGVHRGHVHLLHAAHAARPDAKLGVLTFEPHPRALFRPDDPNFRLSPSAQRATLLQAQGVQQVIEVKFNTEFADLTAEQFIDLVLHQALGAVHVACGADFAFGHRRGGNVAMLEARCTQLGIGLSIVPQLTDTSGPISSSRIRRALQDGYPEIAAHLLGRPWSISGAVSHGEQRGRTIGFPTANIPLGEYLEPARGVYAVWASLPDGRIVPAVANLGRRPTVANTLESRLEVHLFDFAGDLYGQTLEISLIAFLRPEKKFADFATLHQQIIADAEQARAVLAEPHQAAP
jgi:riboflavin kinase/FMN adenylyltransferase